MLTAEGFKRRTFNDFLASMEADARELWGEDVDTSQNDPLGKFLRVQAYQRARDEEEAEAIWNSAHIDTAEGVSLEYAVKRGLIKKKEWLKANDLVQLNIDKGTTVPAGTIVGTPYNVLFKTTIDVTAVDTGNYLVNAEALEYGEIGNVEPNEITIIINPVIGLNSVTNLAAFRNGQDQETDEELRQRYYDSLEKNGNRRNGTIRARILDEVNGVRSCIVIENETAVTDADGRPAHSFETIVLGGAAQEIAEKIKEAKPGGIRAYGQQVQSVIDSQGRAHTIGFTYAASVPIYVKAQVKKGSNYPIIGDKQVKEQIVKFIGGTGNGVQHNGLGMSEDVIQARLEARLFSVEGVEDAKVLLSTDGLTFVEANISIGFAQVADTDFSKIEVINLV